MKTTCDNCGRKIIVVREGKPMLCPDCYDTWMKVEASRNEIRSQRLNLVQQIKSLRQR